MKKKIVVLVAALAFALAVLFGSGQSTSLVQASFNSEQVQIVADGGGITPPPGQG